jgi:hypothetical protein
MVTVVNSWVLQQQGVKCALLQCEPVPAQRCLPVTHTRCSIAHQFLCKQSAYFLRTPTTFYRLLTAVEISIHLTSKAPRIRDRPVIRFPSVLHQCGHNRLELFKWSIAVYKISSLITCRPAKYYMDNRVRHVARMTEIRNAHILA